MVCNISLNIAREENNIQGRICMYCVLKTHPTPIVTIKIKTIIKQHSAFTDMIIRWQCTSMVIINVLRFYAHY